MNALQSNIPPSKHRNTSNRRKRATQLIAREYYLKIFTHSILSGLAIFGLFRLVPYQIKQQENLAEIAQQTHVEEDRVEKLRSDFSRNFDPSQSHKIQQELTGQADPDQRRILFTKEN
jgi:hypothetical protein